MAGTWTRERFPQFEAEIRQLTAQHRELRDEPLHLAVAYDPGRDSQDRFLFEVVDYVGSSEPSLERDLFEATFRATPTLPVNGGEWLHLVLTTSEELPVALEQRWPLADEFRNAVKRGDFEVVFQDEVGQRMMELVRD